MGWLLPLLCLHLPQCGKRRRDAGWHLVSGRAEKVVGVTAHVLPPGHIHSPLDICWKAPHSHSFTHSPRLGMDPQGLHHHHHRYCLTYQAIR